MTVIVSASFQKYDQNGKKDCLERLQILVDATPELTERRIRGFSLYFIAGCLRVKLLVKKDYQKILRDLYDNWNFIYENGGNDPFYTDGVNLNLLRNNIISTRKKCEMELERSQFPEEYDKPLPPVVEDSFIAKKDQIEAAARLSLQKYQQDPDYKYLRAVVDSLDEKIVKDSFIKAVLEYVSGLEAAIQKKDYVTMRRHKDPDRYLSSFTECRRKIERVKRHPASDADGQLSLFDFLNN